MWGQTIISTPPHSLYTNTHSLHTNTHYPYKRALSLTVLRVSLYMDLLYFFQHSSSCICIWYEVVGTNVSGVLRCCVMCVFESCVHAPNVSTPSLYWQSLFLSAFNLISSFCLLNNYIRVVNSPLVIGVLFASLGYNCVCDEITV